MKSLKKVVILLAVVLVALFVTGCQASDKSKYEDAKSLMAKGQYAEAAEKLDTLADYEDSAKFSKYCKAVIAGENGEYEAAIQAFNELGDFNDSSFLLSYYSAFNLEKKGCYNEASITFKALGNYKDAKEQSSQVMERGYEAAAALEAKGDQVGAYKAFMELGDYKDAIERACKPYYLQGEQLRSERKWEEAVFAYTQAIEYSDAATQIQVTRYMEGKAKRDVQDWDGAVEAFEQAGDYSDAKTQIAATRYAEGVSRRKNKDWDGAITAFTAAGSYSDAKDQVKDCRYECAEAYYASGDIMKAMGIFYSIGNYRDSRAYLDDIKAMMSQYSKLISAGYNHFVGIKEDGTVVATGYNSNGQCNVKEEKQVIQVSACRDTSFCLHENGTVSIIGTDVDDGLRQDVRKWTDIVQISSYGGSNFGKSVRRIAGLKSDGTVVATGKCGYGVYFDENNTSEWKDIVCVSAGETHTIGLKKDGTVVSVGLTSNGRCKTEGWSNIVAISAGYDHSVGLRADGRVVTTVTERYYGNDYYSWGKVDDWRDIVAVTAGYFFTAGLKSDGTVVVAYGTSYGDGYEIKREAETWTDIVAIDGGQFCLMGLKSDGTVVTTDMFSKNPGWKLFTPKGGTIKTTHDTTTFEGNTPSQTANVNPGDVVVFGRYEQDADTRNGKEPINWLVLDVQDNKALLISQYALDQQPYNKEIVETDWERCSLRSWLNNYFINEAFSESEREEIVVAKVDNSKSQGAGKNLQYVVEGENTNDKIFLLSVVEAWKYFFTDESRICLPTEYSASRSEYVNAGTSTSWWLRTPAYMELEYVSMRFAAFVNDDGSENGLGFDADLAIRPVFWIDLTNNPFQ